MNIYMITDSYVELHGGVSKDFVALVAVLHRAGALKVEKVASARLADATFFVII